MEAAALVTPIPTTAKGFFQTAGGIAITAVAVFALAFAISKGLKKGKEA